MIGKYEEIGAAIGRLVDKKQKAYGRSFDHVGKILDILYPSGIRPEQYDDLGGMIRILDKMFRIATSKTAFGEDPWEDVAGYALLMNRDLLIRLEKAFSSREQLRPPTVHTDRATFLSPFPDDTPLTMPIRAATESAEPPDSIPSLSSWSPGEVKVKTGGDHV